MVIIDWNCQGSFRTKYEKLLEYKPDILIIQECEKLEYIEYDKENESKKFYCKWKGYNPSKGVAVFSKQNNIIPLDWPNKFPNDEKFNYMINEPEPFITNELLYFFPVKINDLILIVVNTKNLGNIKGKTSIKGFTKYQYTGLITEYLRLNKKEMKDKDIIVAGDFNTNINLCHKPIEKERFRDMLKEFENIELVSLYHVINKINIGEEGKIATRFHNDKKNNIINRPDHIDYCFVSKKFQNCNIKVSEENEWKIDHKGNKRWGCVGNDKDGNKTIIGSDHCPLIIEV